VVHGHGDGEEGLHGVDHAEAGAEDGDEADVLRGDGGRLVGVAEWGVVL
jgi:hypothetical protein